MKKNLFLGLIALTALTVTSCQNDEVMEAVPQKQAIEFGTYLGRDAQARGVILNDANLLNFGVYASYTNGAEWTDTATPNFMYDQKVERASSSAVWTYTPLKYWPTKQEHEYISFFAYAPYRADNNGISVKSSNTATGTPVITYTIDAANLATMADFTADVQMNETKTSAGATPDDSDRNVDFNFKHELTRVAIEAKLDQDAFLSTGTADKTKVNIKQIDFTGTGFASKADYTFASATDERGTWTYTTASSPLNIIAGAAGSVLVNNNTTPLWLDNYNVAGYLLENEDPKKIFGENTYLFLIPPTNAGVTSEKSISMQIYYDIVTADAALDGGYSKTSAVKKIDIPTGIGLLTQGAAYRFTLIFNLNEVTFSANVVDWAAPEGTSNDNVDYPDTDI